MTVLAVACFAVSLTASRRLLGPPPTLARSLGAVMLWTGFFGSVPYLFFVATHHMVRGTGLNWFSSAVLGSLPISMLLSPFVGLYMVLKRFSRHIAETSPTDSLRDEPLDSGGP